MASVARKKFTTNKKINFLFGFLFFLFGLGIILVTSYFSFQALLSHDKEEVGEISSSATVESLMSELEGFERVYTRQDGRILASTGALDIVSIPLFSSITKSQSGYWLRNTVPLSRGTFEVYSDITTELSSLQTIVLTGLVVLFLLSVLVYFISRAIIWYGFSGLESIANYCFSIQQYMAKGDHKSLARAPKLSGAESEEIQTVYSSLVAMNQQIHDYIQQQEVFIHGMSHEFKTQLMNLQSDLDVLVDDLDSSLVSRFSGVQESLDGFKHLVEQLLILAMTDGKLKGHDKESISLVDEVKPILLQYDQTVSDKSLDIVVSLEDDSMINGYKKLVDVLFENLISNAVKYTPEKGTIAIESDGKHIVIRNTAPGLTQDDVASMFDIFWVKDKARSDVSSHGIGLAIVERICAIHSWSVRARLEDGELVIELVA